jgi:hypothetical protein
VYTLLDVVVLNFWQLLADDMNMFSCPLMQVPSWVDCGLSVTAGHLQLPHPACLGAYPGQQLNLSAVTSPVY